MQSLNCFAMKSLYLPLASDEVRGLVRKVLQRCEREEEGKEQRQRQHRQHILGVRPSRTSDDGSDDPEEQEEGEHTDDDEDRATAGDNKDEEDGDEHDDDQQSASSVFNSSSSGSKQRTSKSAMDSARISASYRSLGVPPSILVPLGVDEEEGAGDADRTREEEERAVAMPLALLPPNNAQWDPATVCRAALNLSEQLSGANGNVIILLLRSGRFAGGVFDGSDGRCLAHTTSTKYTTRRGQGGAQSSQDNSKGKAKSMGAQLRRAGEQALREDVASSLAEWRTYVEKAALVLLSCPKTMRKGLHEEGDTASFLPRDDERIRRVPLDVGRPSHEGVVQVYRVMMSVVVRSLTATEKVSMMKSSDDGDNENENNGSPKVEDNQRRQKGAEEETKEKKGDLVVALTPLHEAVKTGDVSTVTDMLALLQVEENDCAEKQDNGSIGNMIDLRAGEDLATPLHLAACLSDQNVAAQCVSSLLLEGHANPCVVDGRNRPPYFLASHEKVRDAFRSARATLGEEFCDWEAGAKVPSALTKDDVQRKKEKAAEKKRKQRQRQKEKKAKERAENEARIKKEQEEAEAKKQEEDAKRIRAGLKPKTVSVPNACNFCQKVCKGKKRSQMFERLDYVYCSTDCVKKHQRELTAAAAMARFG